MKNEALESMHPSWDAAVLVCKACGKRGSGPKKLKGKEVVQELRRALRDARPRPRVVMTNCLGLCPKGAMSVAVVGGGGPTQIARIRKLVQVEAVASLLAAAPASAATPSRSPRPNGDDADAAAAQVRRRLAMHPSRAATDD